MTAACASTAASAAGRGRRPAGGFGPVRRRGKNGKLNRMLGAFTLRTGDFRFLVHDDAFVVLAAIVADVFVDWHSVLILTYQGIWR